MAYRKTYGKRKGRSSYKSSYKRKSYGYKKQRGGSSTTFASKQIASLYNPFTTKNNQPKWPDGKCQYSIGRKHQQASEVSGKELLIAIFPGVGNWVTAFVDIEGAFIPAVAKVEAGDPLVITERAIPQLKQFDCVANHTSALSVGYSHENRDTNEGSVHQWKVPATTHFERWRPVSYALHIRCVNNDEQNEGWFECIRSGRDALSDSFGVTISNIPDKGVKCYPGSIMPQNTAMVGWFKSDGWSLQPTYATGKVRDLGNYVFQLNNQKETNNFQEFKNLQIKELAVDKELYRQNGVEQDDLVYVVPRKELTDNDVITAADVEYFDNTIYHDALDIILIRVHGSDTTKLLLHSVANMEFMMPDSAEYAQYMSVSYPAQSQLDAYRNARIKYNKMPFQSIQSMMR
jgi:hypothetical protein